MRSILKHKMGNKEEELLGIDQGQSLRNYIVFP